MEELRELLNKAIEVLGTRDIITVNISKKLDTKIVEEQRRLVQCRY